MSAQWQKAKEIFGEALKFAPDERASFLDEVCDGDKIVRREVESLLASYDESESFMEKPAVVEVAEIFRQVKNLEPGKSFGHYEIIRQIGAGGMGEVYLAKDSKLDRQVAFKILSEKFSRHESNLNRFIQEAKAASALNHPNILVIHEIGEANDVHFIVSELVEGKTLREILNQSPLQLSEVLDFSIQIANALVAAHTAHIVHRDIKPENIIVRPDGFVKILDFGLAKLVGQQKSLIGLEDETAKQNQTAQGVILGTVKYMSPEQAKGEKIDARTDIFSFGVLLYEMIAGRTPFAGDSMSETFANLINIEPQPLLRYAEGVPDELQRIVSKMLRKNKDERYQTMKGLLADVQDLRENLAFDERLEKSHPPDTENATQILQATTGDANRQTAETNNSFSQKIKRNRLAALAALATFVIALAIVGYFAFFAPQSPITSVAVLPFENGSNDANLDYLSDGLSESVIDRLSELPHLKVIARNSSFKYRGENIDLQDAANKLGVQAIVTGRVIQRGDTLSIRVEMVDVRDNRQLWSEQYNRRTADALTIQQEIAQTVSEKLRLKLSGAEEQQLAKQNTVNPQAYELLLKGRFLNIKEGTEDVKKAILYYQQAIAADPNYALAYAKLSESYRTLIGPSVLDPKEFTPKAKAAALKAFELDPNLAEAQLELANHYQNAWDWEAAEAKYQHAIELNPNFAMARNNYSLYLSVIGRYDESIAEARRAKELDPLTLSNLVSYGIVLMGARRYDEAIAEFKKILEVDRNSVGTHYWLGLAYAGKGMYREAIDSYQESIRLGNKAPGIQTYLGEAYAKTGEWKKAQTILQHSETSGEYVSPGELTVLYTALDEREKAFASLEKAYAAHDLQLQFLKVESGFDPLRDDPRFQDLLRRVGFPTDVR